MSTVPPGHEPHEDADELYRRASALDPGRPSEATRRAILAHAERLADAASRPPQRRAVLPRARWRPALFGTLAAAMLAGLVIAPRYLIPDAPLASPPVAARPVAPADVSGGIPAAAPPADLYVAEAAPHAESPAPARKLRAPRPAAAQRAPAESPGAEEQMTIVTTQAAPVPASPQSPTAGAPAGGLPQADAVRSADTRSLASARSEGLMAGMRAPGQAGQVREPSDPAAALRQAAQAGDMAALDALLAGQTDLNARDGAGRTALLLATLQGRGPAVETLLAHGADPNLADAAGLTPLAAAQARGDNALAGVLQAHGAR